MQSIDARIAYYTRKVAEYGSIHWDKRPKRFKYRCDRLLDYKARMHELINESRKGE